MLNVERLLKKRKVTKFWVETTVLKTNLINVYHCAVNIIEQKAVCSKFICQKEKKIEAS